MILLVEDNSLNVDVAVGLLSKQGYEIESVSSLVTTLEHEVLRLCAALNSFLGTASQPNPSASQSCSEIAKRSA